MGDGKSDVLQGTLDLMVLKTLESMGRCMDTFSRGGSSRSMTHTVIMNQGTIYPALLRLQQRIVDQGANGAPPKPAVVPSSIR